MKRWMVWALTLGLIVAGIAPAGVTSAVARAGMVKAAKVESLAAQSAKTANAVAGHQPPASGHSKTTRTAPAQTKKVPPRVLIRNPITLWGRPLSLPDPDVFWWPTVHLYVASGTSDFGQYNPIPGTHKFGNYPAGFPLYTSKDLVHWHPAGFIFPPGHHPAQTSPILGNWPGPEFWADEIHWNFVARVWNAYFGAQLSGTRHFALFVCWSKRLLAGDFSRHCRVLYTDTGGYIDPSVARDPKTGVLHIVFVRQPRQILYGTLTPDGHQIVGQPQVIITPTLPWEGDCVEGPVLWYNAGKELLLYNAASTWNDSYAVGIATYVNGVWQKRNEPLLHSNNANGLVSTGIGAQPFVSPSGHLMLAFHVQLEHGKHTMEGRWLAFKRLLIGPDGPYIAGAMPSAFTANHKRRS